jgi:tetratricopeptide (TPR) repeat protein
VTLKAGNQVFLDETTAIDPGKPFRKRMAIPAGVDEHDLRAAISVGGKELVAYTPVRLTPQPMPKPVVPPLPPKEIKSNEELYLAGLRLQQFHDATREPVPYWEEALSRDPGDVRINTALGVYYFKRARYAEAEKYLRQAIERLTANYTTPKDAEAIYYLGAVLKAQGRQDEAFKTLYQATWGAAWRSASYGLLAEIATQRGNLAEAMNCVERALEANALDIRSLNLRAALLRHLGRPAEALQVLDYATRKADPLDVRSMAERWLASRNAQDRQAMTTTMNQHPTTAQETAAEYFDAGLWEDGLEVLRQTIAAAPDAKRISPMIYYYLGYFTDKLGRGQEAADAYRLAATLPPDYVFPFQSEAMVILKQAMAANPKDARAPYYLGNLLFDWQPEAAVKWWEQAAALDPLFPIVHRNLAIAYSHQTNSNSLEKAVASLETAVALPHKYPAHFAELDELYEAVGAPPEKRLALLEQNQEAVTRRDGALSREIGLEVVVGKYDEAIRSMTGREFAVWEGGTLSVANSWTDAHLLRGQSRFAAKDYALALADFQAAGKIPDNLPSDGRGGNARQAELAYWLGVVYEAMGDAEKARESWQGVSGRAGGGGRNFSGRNVQRYFRALALRKLGKNEEATPIFRELVETSQQAIEKEAKADAAASLSARLSQRTRLASAHHAAGLGYWGQGEADKARQEFLLALQVCPDHLGAKAALAEMQ